MKQKVSPVMVAIAVLAVAGIAFALYKVSFSSRPHNVSAANAPDYVKNQKPNYGSGAGYAGNGYQRPPGQPAQPGPSGQ